MEHIASGRAGTIVDLGDGTVRKVAPGDDLTTEALTMSFVAGHGFPVPRLISHTEDAIIMERIEGFTMGENLRRRPWRLGRYARQLAELHRRLHELPAPPWMRRIGDGKALLHLDLHVENVMISERGPVVLDWANAAVGDPMMDVALTWVIMATSFPDGSDLTQRLARLGSGMFVRRFLASFDGDAVVASLGHAGAFRSNDRNVDPEERERVRRLVHRCSHGL